MYGYTQPHTQPHIHPHPHSVDMSIPGVTSATEVLISVRPGFLPAVGVPNAQRYIFEAVTMATEYVLVLAAVCGLLIAISSLLVLWSQVDEDDFAECRANNLKRHSLTTRLKRSDQARRGAVRYAVRHGGVAIRTGGTPTKNDPRMVVIV